MYIGLHPYGDPAKPELHCIRAMADCEPEPAAAPDTPVTLRMRSTPEELSVFLRQTFSVDNSAAFTIENLLHASKDNDSWEDVVDVLSLSKGHTCHQASDGTHTRRHGATCIALPTRRGLRCTAMRHAWQHSPWRGVARHGCACRHGIAWQRACVSICHGTSATTEPPNRPPCLLYTSPSPRDATLSRMPSSA